MLLIDVTASLPVYPQSLGDEQTILQVLNITLQSFNITTVTQYVIKQLLFFTISLSLASATSQQASDVSFDNESAI